QFSFVKTIIMPIITLTIIYIANNFGILTLSKESLGVVIIMMGTPTASVTIAYSLKYNREPLITSCCSLLSTVFSLITIPTLIAFLHFIYS
ncbi:MAG: AEC family transporter, partial [Cetobacterium sp.]